MDITTNWHARELLAGYEIPEKVWNENFAYLGEWVESNEETMDKRFFTYRGSWYSTDQFTALRHSYWGNPDGELTKAGWDAVQSDSVWSGIAIRYAKQWDGTPDWESVIVASFYWG